MAQDDKAEAMINRQPTKRKRSAMRDFMRGEALGGIVLMAAAALGLIAANSAQADRYFGALAAHLPRYQRSMANYARALVEPDPAANPETNVHD